MAVDTDRRGELLRITLLLPPRTPVLGPDRRRAAAAGAVRRRVTLPELGQVMVLAGGSRVRVGQAARGG